MADVKACQLLFSFAPSHLTQLSEDTAKAEVGWVSPELAWPLPMDQLGLRSTSSSQTTYQAAVQ